MLDIHAGQGAEDDLGARKPVNTNAGIRSAATGARRATSAQSARGDAVAVNSPLWGIRDRGRPVMPRLGCSEKASIGARPVMLRPPSEGLREPAPWVEPAAARS